MEAFAWLGDLVERLGSLIPRLLIVRATHAGVRWRNGKEALPLEPGIHVYWPIVTEIDVIVVARQTLKVTGQVLTTLDGKEVVVGTVVVYRIHDVVKAIGKKNWDVDSTLSDITEAATMDVVASTTFEDILAGIGNGMIADRLTKACRSELRRYGVYVSRARMSDFARCKVHKLVGNQPEALAA